MRRRSALTDSDSFLSRSLIRLYLTIKNVSQQKLSLTYELNRCIAALLWSLVKQCVGEERAVSSRRCAHSQTFNNTMIERRATSRSSRAGRGVVGGPRAAASANRTAGEHAHLSCSGCQNVARKNSASFFRLVRVVDLAVVTGTDGYDDRRTLPGRTVSLRHLTAAVIDRAAAGEWPGASQPPLNYLSMLQRFTPGSRRSLNVWLLLQQISQFYMQTFYH